MSVDSKIIDFVESSRIEYTHVFAVVGENSIIDCVHPLTGLSTFSKETLEQVKLRYPKAVLMTFADYMEAKVKRQNTPIKWLASDQETFEEQRCCLPPAAYSTDYRAFLVGEPWDHSAKDGQPRFIAYANTQGHYQRSSRPMTVKEFREATR